MKLTEAKIKACNTDKELFNEITAELERQIPVELKRDLKAFVNHIRRLPAGLRAMAATHELDVSITLDDLGWHFANHHYKPYCEETLWGLKELDAQEAAYIFSASFELVLPYWEKIGSLVNKDFKLFIDWYNDSELEKALAPLNHKIWNLLEPLEDYGLMSYWLVYARKYPAKLINVFH
jgi:hypothetical protein